MAISGKVRKIAESYQQLNADERDSFAELVAPICDSELSAEWMAEVKNRADDIDSGRVELLDGEECMRALRMI